VEVEEVEETKAGLAKAKGYTDNERLGWGNWIPAWLIWARQAAMHTVNKCLL
jgi:hypothetical protein